MREVELHEVCDVIAGQSPPSSTYNQDGIGVPFFQGKADFGEKFPTVRYWCSEPKKFTSPGDLLFSLRAPVGPTNFNQVEASIGRGLAAIRCREGMDVDFLRFYFLHNEDKIEALGNGSTFKAITNKTLKALKVPLLPLEEQKRIAGILDEADRVRKKTQALIDKYDELAQSLFLDMFGDPFRKNQNHQFLNLGSVVERIQIGPFGSQLHEQDYTVGGIPLINPKNIISSQIVVDLNKSITRMKYDTLPNYHLSEGDVILGRRGQMGRAAYVGASENGFFCGTGSLFLRPKNRVNGKYLAYVLGSTFSEDYFDRNALGVTMKNLNKTIVSECCVVWPDDGVQSFFLERVDEIEGAIRAAKREESRVSNLFNALLQKAFKGELT